MNNVEQFQHQLQVFLIESYFQTVAEVNNNKKLASSEKLKKLLKPLVILKALDPNSRLNFIDENINFESELDLKRLIRNSEKYIVDTDGDIFFQKSRVLNTRYRNIYLVEMDGSIAEYVSIAQMHKCWLLTLTQEKMKSNDLLDQMLVIFTIKRALNGDSDSIEKLHSLFIDTAEAIAIKLATRRRAGGRVDIPFDDIRQEANTLLRLLIAGFTPEQILKALTLDARGLLRIPKSVEKLYIEWLTKEGPARAVEIMGQPLSNIDPMYICVLLDPASPIRADTEWRLTPKAVRRFNSFSFRPNCKTNLYTWLFGIKCNPVKGVTSGFMQGRFCQFFSEWLDGRYKSMSEVSCDFSELDGGFEEKGDCFDESNSYTGLSSLPEELTFDDEAIMKAKELLIRRGFDKRDIEIIVLKLEGLSYAEIAEKYSLSRRQIINICNKVKKKT